MNRPDRHPIDGVLADLGSLVRSVRAGTLTPQTYSCMVERICSEARELDADPHGLVSRQFDFLDAAEAEGVLTPILFEEAVSAIRQALNQHRERGMLLVPNFAVLPSGIHGRPVGRLMVIDGGIPLNNQAQIGA